MAKTARLILLLVGAACSRAETPAIPALARLTSEQEVSGAYRQGVARVEDGWIFSTNLALYRTDEGLRETVRNERAIPPEWATRGYNHIGDIDVVAGIVYAPLEQPDFDEGRQAMFRYDAATLQFLDGVEVEQHENSYVAVDPETLTAYTMDWFGGEAQLRYDVKAGWKPLPPLPMSRSVDKVQGADLARGALWLSTDDDRDRLYRVRLPTGETDAIGSLGHVDGEAEGIDATELPSGLLHALSIDAASLPVRFLHFALEPEAGGPP